LYYFKRHFEEKAFKAEKVGTTVSLTEENKECFEGHSEPIIASMKKKTMIQCLLGIQIV
jgi:hypothetical protein